MKLSTILMMVFTLNLSATGFGQFTFSVEGKKVRDVFDIIEKKSNYRFFYNDDLESVDKVVNLKFENQNINQVLDKLLESTDFNYKVFENNLIVVSLKEGINKQSELQQFTVKGTITDQKGKPMPGVTVLIKGTTKGSTTDVNGNYFLETDNPQATLVFSFIGYISQEIAIDNKTQIDVSMGETVVGLEEVSIVGYGTQKKATLTGAQVAIKGVDVLENSSASVSNSLAGRMPGVIANNRSGRPGDDNSEILIRGLNSFGGGTRPLIVLDGIPDRDMNRLNPDDIESVTILKDASAAIYGVRSANGVILITTKRGKSGKPSIHIDGSVGTQQFTRLIPRVGAWQWETYQNELAVNQGSTPVYTQAEIDKWKAGNDPNYQSNDWTASSLRKNAPQNTESVSVSGGNEQVKYFFSSQYLNQTNNFRNSDGHFDEVNIRSNIDVKVSSNIKINLDIAARKEDRLYGVIDSVIFSDIYNMPPIYPVYWPNGSLDFGYHEGWNPAIEASPLLGYDKINNLIMNPKLGFDIQLPFIVKGLSLSGYDAFDVKDASEKRLTKPWVAYTFDRITGTYSENGNTNSPPGIITLSQDEMWYNENTGFLKLAFDRQFGKHYINSFVGYEQTTYYLRKTYSYRKDLLSDQLEELFTGPTTDQVGTGSAAQFGRESYLGRVAYNYADKYMADFTARYNGSFNFPSNKRWGLFPSLSLGWRISAENFFKNNINAIEDLKIRASWGLMGSDAVAQYLFLARYQFTTDPVDNVYFGNYTQVPTLQNGTSNPNITWEKQDTKNIGFDATLLSHKLNVSFDAFRYLRSDILAQPSASVPLYTGLTLPDENIGKSLNRGIDFSVNYNESLSKLKYNIGANFTYARSKIIFRDEAANIPSWQRSTGHSIDSWLVYETNGIYRTQAEVDNSPHLSGTGPGDLWIKDIDGDGKITSNDMVRINESATPHIVYGITMGIEYKGIALNLLWSGQAIAEQSILTQLGLGGGAQAGVPPTWLFDGRWTADNPINSIYPRPYQNFIPADFWLKDASFLRLKSAELSYTLPANIFAKYGISKVRVYINGFNLFSFDKMKKYGIDPEQNNLAPYVGTASTNSFIYAYPVTRIFKLGVSIDL